MTVTSLSSGAPVRRERRRARWGAALVVLLGLGGTIATGVPAHAATEPTPTPTPTPPSGVVGFTLAPVGSGLVAGVDDLTVSMFVDNDTLSPLPAGGVTLGIGTKPLTDRAALSTWLDQTDAADTLPVAAEQDMPSVTALTARAVAVTVDADDPALADRDPGVYPLVARYESGGEEFVSTSAMIVTDASASARVGVVVPITAGTRSTGLLAAEELAALTGPDGSLTAQLDAVDGTPAILAVDPALVASIRVLGTSAPASAAGWLDDLMSLPNARFALQFGDADVAVQLDAGLDRPLGVRSLAYALDPADFVPRAPATPTPTPTSAASPTPTATPGPDPDAPVLPTQDELLDIGPARTTVFWPAPGAADGAVIQDLAPVSDTGEAVTLIPSSSTTDGAAGRTVTARAAVGDDAAPALVYDSDISAALQSASLASDGAPRAAALTKARALLAFAVADAGDAPLLVTVDRGVERTRLGLRSAISAVTDAAGVEPVSLAPLVRADAVSRNVPDAEPDAARVAATSGLLSGERSIEDFATVLEDTNLLTGPERSALLQLLGVAWTTQSSGWVEAVAAHREQTATTLGSVGILPSPTIQLLSPGSDLPFAVRNDLPFRINAVLFTTPDDFRLDVQPATAVVAEPRSNQGVRVPVQARVGSGQVELRLQLRSPTGIPIGQTQYADVEVRADWEAYGITLLAVVVTGLLGIGLFRTIRRRRRVAAAADASAAEPGRADTGDGEHR